MISTITLTFGELVAGVGLREADEHLSLTARLSRLEELMHDLEAGHIRAEDGLTQGQVADVLGISQQRVAALEKRALAKCKSCGILPQRGL